MLKFWVVDSPPLEIDLEIFTVYRKTSNRSWVSA